MDIAHPHLTLNRTQDNNPFLASFWLVTNSLHIKIVFYSNRDGNAEIYTIDSDGGNRTRLTFED